MNQNLSQYKIFYEVAKAGNISKAAKKLYISQPAISKSISKLEDSLGTILFNRNSRGVLLTEEGHVLFKYAASAFEALVDLCQYFGQKKSKDYAAFFSSSSSFC